MLELARLQFNTHNIFGCVCGNNLETTALRSKAEFLKELGADAVDHYRKQNFGRYCEGL
jgi:hypothetical protein